MTALLSENTTIKTLLIFWNSLEKHSVNRILSICTIRFSVWRKSEMTKAEILKKEILQQYRSVRQFAMEMNIPYSTLVTALERGIEGMAYGTVIDRKSVV